MVKNLLRAFLVFRLEFHQPTLTFEAMLSYWRARAHRPVRD